MGKLWFGVLLLSSFLLAQDSNPGNPSQDNSKAPKGEVILRGCVSRSAANYILMLQNPAMTYRLQGTGKIKVSYYLGQQVEVTGTKSPSMSTSSDALRTGSPASETLTVTSIKTINKECHY